MLKHRLLVIEDDKNISNIVCRVGSELDFDVRATRDFTEIVSLHDAFLPHVVVLDILMPGIDGFETLHLLRERNSASSVIIFSGQEDYRPMASKMGEALGIPIVATIAKPFHIAKLRFTLEQVKSSLPMIQEGLSAEAVA